MTSYMESLDVPGMLADHPIGEDFESLASSISRDELFARQDRLFQRCVERAWQTGFYQRLWGNAGIEPAFLDMQNTERRVPFKAHLHLVFLDYSDLHRIAPKPYQSVVIKTVGGGCYG